MAAVLKSASKSQALKLVVKALFLALIVFWARSSGGFWPGVFFVILFILLYFKPLAGSLKFLPSAAVASYLPFIIPKSEFYLLEILIAFILGLLYYLILGIKNLIFLRRRRFYQFSHFLIFALLILAYLHLPTQTGQVILFFLLTLLFREFYSFLSDGMTGRVINVISLVGAFIIIEIFWVTTLLPLFVATSAVFITLILFVLHDIALSYKNGFLTNKIIIRDTVAFSILSIILFIISKWSLS